MKRAFRLSPFVALAMLCITPSAYPAAAPVTWKGTVDGIARTALVFPGKDALTIASPLLFFFHSAIFDAHVWSDVAHFQLAWPEATVVYPQGIGINWPNGPGKAGDHDVHFVDALLKDLSATYKVDERRVYASGFSSGAFFLNLLLTVHPEPFAAFAPGGTGLNPYVRHARVPRPVLIIMGKRDGTTPLAGAERLRDQLLRLNGCGTQTVEWAPGAVSYQPCASGQPVIWFVHDEADIPGFVGHIWPSQGTANVVRFFKEHALPGPAPAVALPTDLNTSDSVAGSGQIGTQGDGGLATEAHLSFPEAVAVGVGGDLFIADTGNSRIRKVGQEGIITPVSSGFSNPFGLTLDREGNLFVADTYAGRVQEVAADGTSRTVIDKSELSLPTAVAVDSQGNLFVADGDSHRVRKMSRDGSIVTVAGTGAAGFSGDQGPATAAQLNAPWGLALDGQGNLFIADSFNHRIRRLATDGKITTVAGTGTPGFAGDDGLATAAQLQFPTGVAVDSRGNLFIADSLNHRVRKVGLEGMITTVIGGEPGGSSGAAPAIPLHYPSSIAVDPAGNILVADPFHHRIWKVSGLAAPGLLAGLPFPKPKQP